MKIHITLARLAVVGTISVLIAFTWTSSLMLLRHERTHHHGGAWVSQRERNGWVRANEKMVGASWPNDVVVMKECNRRGK